jgi:hypothetical protein
MPLKAKIQSISGERATLVLEDGQTLSVALTQIEGTAKEGAEVAVIVAALGAEDAGRSALARNLLNELLHP